MNTFTKFLLWLVPTIILAWLWFGPWYDSWERLFCPSCFTVEAIAALEDKQAATADKRGALDFKWGVDTPFTNVGFEAYKKSILARQNEENLLEITGLYYESEPTIEGHENLGFARASEVKALFADDLSEERMRIRARALQDEEGAQEGYFEGIVFKWLEPEKQEKKESVEKLADRVIVRFPYNSTERISDPAIDEYLDKVAARVAETGERIRLTGHTDNIGNDQFNTNLGERRAKAIYELLIDKGVPPAQVIVDSKGSRQPVASNDTEQGRSENRRVEVRLLKESSNN